MILISKSWVFYFIFNISLAPMGGSPLHQWALRLSLFCMQSLFFLFSSHCAVAGLTSELPPIDQFQSALFTCAAGAKIEIDGKLQGSITKIYRGATVELQGDRFVFYTASEFLSLLPEEDRLSGYRVYMKCISDILSLGSSYLNPTEIYTLPKVYVTNGQPLHVEAKTIIAENSRILSFPDGHSARHGRRGQDGRDGRDGLDEWGGLGEGGTNGNSGSGGENGRNADTITLIADEFIGNLVITNSGGNGGNGGDGGDGGNGGSGGRGRAALIGARDAVMGIFGCRRPPGNGGSGGSAGSGGAGGVGGRGGDGGSVVLRFKKIAKSSTILMKSPGGMGGRSGNGGRAGSPGRGGAVGLHDSVYCGSRGRKAGIPGAKGVGGTFSKEIQNGEDGQIEVIVGKNLIKKTGSLYISN